MDIPILIFTVLKLSILIFLGMGFTTKVPFSNEVRHFNIFIILNIALPAIILYGYLQVEKDHELITFIFTVFLLSFFFHLFTLFFTATISKLIGIHSRWLAEIMFISTFGNTAIIGIPLCAAIFGAKGAVIGAAYDAGMTVILWTVGIYILQVKKMQLNIRTLLTPPLMSVIFGLIIVIFHVQVNAFVTDIVGTLANLTIPLAMIYIGMLTVTMIKNRQQWKIPIRTLILPVLIKLLIVPFIGMIFLFTLPPPAEIKLIVLIQMTMPTITTASIIFSKYNRMENIAVIATLITTFLSLITVPLIMYIVHLINPF